MEITFCPNCGHQNQPGSRFCEECGCDLIQAARAQQAKQEVQMAQQRLDEFYREKEAAEEAKEVLENAEMICLDQLPEECAFITTDMTQGEFCAKAEKLGDKVLAKIRVKD